MSDHGRMFVELPHVNYPLSILSFAPMYVVYATMRRKTISSLQEPSVHEPA